MIMKKLQVKTNFSQLRKADLEITAQSIVAHMTGNEHFSALAPEVADVQAAHVAYAQALAASYNSGTAATAAKDARRKELEHALKVLGVKINLMAAGNRELLETTAFPLNDTTARQRLSNEPLEKIAGLDFEVRRGTGSVKVSVDELRGAVAYKYGYTPAPVTEDSVWNYVETTDHEYLFTGLTIGREYAFKVAGIGKHPERVYSDVMTSYAI